ncbi:MAG: hypothetical protein R3A11_03390 [Bdellovibrionota bacterium]
MKKDKHISFDRYYCCGRSLALIHARDLSQEGVEELAKKMCDPFVGVGAQFLALVSSHEKSVCRIQVFDSLGKKIKHDETALLSAAHWLHNRDGVDHVLFLDDRFEKKVTRFENDEFHVDLEPPAFDARSIPISTHEVPWGKPISIKDIRLKMYCLSIGEPFAVCFLDWQKNLDWISKIGPELEGHFLFPKKASIVLAFVLNPQNLIVRVWERGRGLQQGSLGGAAAAAVVAIRNEKAQSPVWVHTNAGKSQVYVMAQGVCLRTQPVHLFSGQFPLG